MVVEHSFDKVVARLLSRSRNFETPLRDFYGYMLRRTERTFRMLGKKGNSSPFRSVLWKWFAPQYTRKDGTIVPAEGGIPKVRSGYSYRTKSGKLKKNAIRDIETGGAIGAKKTSGDMVLGRLRHSNTRIKTTSRMMQDRGSLRQAALARFRIGKNSLVAQTPPVFAKYQQAMRPFVFIEENKDELILKDMVLKWLVE